MVMISYFETNEISLVDCMELFFNELKDKSNNTFEAYYYTIQNMSREIFKVDVQYLKREQLQSLTYNVLNQYKNKLKDTCSNTTINNKMSAIKSFIKHLKEHDVIDYDISKLALVKNLNDDSENTEMIPSETLMEYVTYFENYEQRKGSEKKWVTLLGFETGNRIQDLLSLKKNQFIKDNDSYILKSKGENKGKGNKGYAKRVGTVLYDELMKLNPDSDKIFSIKYNAVLDAFNRANEHFGNTLIRYTPHSVKKLAVTTAYRDTGDILYAQEIGSHSSILTTRRYIEMEDMPLVGAYSRMISTKNDKYKEAKEDELIKVISDLPMYMQLLINKKLEDLSNDNCKLS